MLWDKSRERWKPSSCREVNPGHLAWATNDQRIFPHVGNKCYEARIEVSEKAGSRQESNPARTPLAWAISALPLNHDSWAGQPPTLTILYVTVQVVLNASVAHLTATQYTCRQNSIRGWPESSLHQGKNPCWVVFLTLNSQSMLPYVNKCI